MLILQLLLLAVFIYILRQRRRQACVYEKRKYLVSTIVFVSSIMVSIYARFAFPNSGGSMSSPEALLNTLTLLLILISLSELILTFLLFRKRDLIEQIQQRYKDQQSE
jgi:hypothetical protein